jgi:hypothetical protein
MEIGIYVSGFHISEIANTGIMWTDISIESK